VDYAQIGSLLRAFDLDLVALQEVDGPAAVEMLGFEAPWTWVTGESGWSQNIAFLWRADRVSVTEVREVHLAANEWPSKDPLVGEVTAVGGTLAFTFVGVHFNPFSDSADAELRYEQARDLRAWLDQELAPDVHRAPFNDHVVVAGDFNDTFEAMNDAWPSLSFFEDPGGYRFLTRDTDDYTELSYRSQIDHILVSDAMQSWIPQLGQRDGCHVIAHDQLRPWCCYSGGYGGRANISDHRPVWAWFDLEGS
jgi:endonuclease/exonuclease/phosphatase family metal-dependent hydrolase